MKLLSIPLPIIGGFITVGVMLAIKHSAHKDDGFGTAAA